MSSSVLFEQLINRNKYIVPRTSNLTDLTIHHLDTHTKLWSAVHVPLGVNMIEATVNKDKNFENRMCRLAKMK